MNTPPDAGTTGHDVRIPRPPTLPELLVATGLLDADAPVTVWRVDDGDRVHGTDDCLGVTCAAPGQVATTATTVGALAARLADPTSRSLTGCGCLLDSDPLTGRLPAGARDPVTWLVHQSFAHVTGALDLVATLRWFLDDTPAVCGHPRLDAHIDGWATHLTSLLEQTLAGSPYRRELFGVLAEGYMLARGTAPGQLPRPFEPLRQMAATIAPADTEDIAAFADLAAPRVWVELTQWDPGTQEPLATAVALHTRGDRTLALVPAAAAVLARTHRVLLADDGYTADQVHDWVALAHPGTDLGDLVVALHATTC